jgi:hypothetical protein
VSGISCKLLYVDQQLLQGHALRAAVSFQADMCLLYLLHAQQLFIRFVWQIFILLHDVATAMPMFTLPNYLLFGCSWQIAHICYQKISQCPFSCAADADDSTPDPGAETATCNV